MTSVRFGNLSIKNLEEFTGIKFSQEDFEFLMSTRVDKVSDACDKGYKIPPMTWHCFDAPFVQIHCGSKQMASKITSIISFYMVDGSFPNSVRVGITHETIPEDVFGYKEKMKMIDSGAKVYVGEHFYKDTPEIKSVIFWVKIRETQSGNMFIQEVQQMKNGDFSNFKVVPLIDKVQMERDYTKEVRSTDFEKLVPVKPIRKKMREDEVYMIEDFMKKITIKLWDGEPVVVSAF